MGFVIMCILAAILICILPFFEIYAFLVVPAVFTIIGTFIGAIVAAGFDEFIDDEGYIKFAVCGALGGLVLGLWIYSGS